MLDLRGGCSGRGRAFGHGWISTTQK